MAKHVHVVPQHFLPESVVLGDRHQKWVFSQLCFGQHLEATTAEV